MKWVLALYELTLWGITVESINAPSYVTFMGVALILAGFFAYNDN